MAKDRRHIRLTFVECVERLILDSSARTEQPSWTRRRAPSRPSTARTTCWPAPRRPTRTRTQARPSTAAGACRTGRPGRRATRPRAAARAGRPRRARPDRPRPGLRTRKTPTRPQRRRPQSLRTAHDQFILRGVGIGGYRRKRRRRGSRRTGSRCRSNGGLGDHHPFIGNPKRLAQLQQIGIQAVGHAQ